MATPAAAVKGWDEKVPPPIRIFSCFFTFLSGDVFSRISFFPTTAPTGRPPPVIFPRVARSGVIPNLPCAPFERDPESRDDFVKDQEGPQFLRFSAKHLQIVERGGHKPSFADDGLQNDGGEVFPILVDDLAGTLQVVERKGLRMSLMLRPEAETFLLLRKGHLISTMRSELGPCHPPAILRIIFLPVCARARRTAYMVASVPEQQKRTISAQGMRSQISSAHSTCFSKARPQWIPCFNCSSIASQIIFGRWPRMCVKLPSHRSRYSFPSTSQSVGPWAPLI